MYDVYTFHNDFELNIITENVKCMEIILKKVHKLYYVYYDNICSEVIYKYNT